MARAGHGSLADMYFRQMLRNVLPRTSYAKEFIQDVYSRFDKKHFDR